MSGTGEEHWRSYDRPEEVEPDRPIDLSGADGGLLPPTHQDLTRHERRRPSTRRVKRPATHPWRYVAMGAGVAVAGLVVLVAAASGDGSGGPRSNDHFDPYDPVSFRAMVAAVEERTGSTRVLEVVLIPEHHYIDVHARASSGGDDADEYYYDGTLTRADYGSQEPGAGFDLADIDPTKLAGTCAAVHEPTTTCGIAIESTDHGGAYLEVGEDSTRFNVAGERLPGR